MEAGTVAAVAAALSAVAATFAAISSFLIYRTERQNLVESIRPQLLLEDWTRYPAERSIAEVFKFGRIRNVGRGTALHIGVYACETIHSQPTYIMATPLRLPTLAPGEPVLVDGSIEVWWEVVRGINKRLPMVIRIFCHDTAGNQHETTYHMLCHRDKAKGTVTSLVAPGFELGMRIPRMVSVDRLRRFRKLKKIPIVKTFVRRWYGAES